MKLFVFPVLSALALAGSALAAPLSIQPKAGAPVCLKRVYSQEHLAKYPQQKLTALYVKLAVERSGSWKYNSAKLVGVSRDGQLWGNDQPGCELKPNGGLHCFVECDGGSFDVAPEEKTALLQVTKDYYFPLFRHGVDPENAREEDTMSFMGEDRDNSTYRLQKVDVRECDGALKRIRIPALGC